MYSKVRPKNKTWPNGQLTTYGVIALYIQFWTIFINFVNFCNFYKTFSTVTTGPSSL